MTILDLIMNRDAIETAGMPCFYAGQRGAIVSYRFIKCHGCRPPCYARIQMADGRCVEIKPRYIRKG
jgi:hypothetical protein